MTLEQTSNIAEFLVLLIVAVTIIFLTVRVRKSATYRCALGLALAAPFLLVWINLAVGIIGEPDNPANLMYFGVLAVAFIGAIMARFRPNGMARAMFITALAQTMVAVIVLIAGLGSPPSGPRWVLTFNGFFIALWLGSAWLFRGAAREQAPAA